MELVSSAWGVSKTFDLPLVTYGATDFVTGVTLATGDVKISKDGGAFANIATLPTINGAWMEVTLSATEMEASRIKVQVVDQTATKIFEDTGAIMSTFLMATVATEATLESISGDIQDINLELDGLAQESTLESISGDINTIKGTGFDTNVHSLKEIKHRIG